jgi:hypothetical protein
MPYVPSAKTDGKQDDRTVMDPAILALAKAIAKVSARHGYEAAFAGELNYSLTRLIQEIPRELIAAGQIKEELRYWLQPLLYGVLLDVALEHKRRVNVAYEAEQIIKSGDCYDTPYYSRLVEVIDGMNNHVGWQEILLKRSEQTIGVDQLALRIRAEEKS